MSFQNLEFFTRNAIGVLYPGGVGGSSLTLAVFLCCIQSLFRSKDAPTQEASFVAVVASFLNFAFSFVCFFVSLTEPGAYQIT